MGCALTGVGNAPALSRTGGTGAGEEKWLGKGRGFGETLAGHEEQRFEDNAAVMGSWNRHSGAQEGAVAAGGADGSGVENMAGEAGMQR
jgi:hypothetical protein